MAIFYVNENAAPGGDGLSEAAAFQTIQEAINAATNDLTGTDEIHVADGDYAENIVITSSVTLSGTGRGNATIIGQGDFATGTVVIAPDVNGVTINGFTIEGIDHASPGIESGAIYLQGAHNNITISNNDIVAKGDVGLYSEFAASQTNILITGNEFSGQTFSGDGTKSAAATNSAFRTSLANWWL